MARRVVAHRLFKPIADRPYAMKIGNWRDGYLNDRSKEEMKRYGYKVEYAYGEELPDIKDAPPHEGTMMAEIARLRLEKHRLRAMLVEMFDGADGEENLRRVRGLAENKFLMGEMQPHIANRMVKAADLLLEINP